MSWSSTGHFSREPSSLARSLPPAPNSRLTVMRLIEFVRIDPPYIPTSQILDTARGRLGFCALSLQSRARSQAVEEEFRSGIDKLIAIDRHARRSAAELLPGQLENEARYRDTGGDLAVHILAEFAAGFAFLDELGENLPGASRTILEPSLIEFRDLAGHPLYQEGQYALARRIRLTKGASQKEADCCGYGTLSFAKHLLQREKNALVVILDRLTEQVLFRLEVVIDRALRHPDCGGYILEAR